MPCLQCCKPISLSVCLSSVYTFPSDITNNMYRRRGRGGNIGLFLLAMQFARTGLHTIPIVTLIVCGVNIGIYMFNPLHLSIQEVCILPFLIVHELSISRLLLAAYYHADDMHLVFEKLTHTLRLSPHIHTTHKHNNLIIIINFSLYNIFLSTVLQHRLLYMERPSTGA